MEQILCRHRPLCAYKDGVITYKKGSIYIVNSHNPKKICDLPMKKGVRFFSQLRIFERLLRTEARTGILLKNNSLLIAQKGFIYNISLATHEVKCEHSFSHGMSAPFYMTKIEDLRGFEDTVVYGEYVSNNNRELPVSIWGRNMETNMWSIKYTFPAGMIRHIHGIKCDYEHNCLYILTGDNDNEAGIWKCKDNFKYVKPLLIGKQQYRAVNVFPQTKKIVYATDSPNERNHIYSYENSGNLKNLYLINGSSIYSSESKDYIFISSSVEPDERIRGWKSWLNYKLGEGILSHDVCLYAIKRNNLSLHKILTFKKDLFPYKLFQYGHCSTVYNDITKQLYVYAMGVKKYDGKLICLSYGSTDGEDME